MSLSENILAFRSVQLRVEALDEAMRGNPSTWQRIKHGVGVAAVGAAAMLGGATGARADDVVDATMAHHHGAHFTNVQQNVARARGIQQRDLGGPADYKGQAAAEVTRVMADSNPANVGKLSPANQSALARTAATHRANVDRARNPQERAERLSAAGAQVHAAHGMLMRQQARSARRATERAQDMNPRGASTAPAHLPTR